VVGDRAVIGIDSCATQARTLEFRRHLSSVTTRRVTTLVNTHHHGDHTYGNWLFAEAVIVGHTNCRSEILEAGLPNYPGIWEPVEWGEIHLRPPTLTFSEAVTLWSDDVPIDVRFVGGPAHTSNDCLVHFPQHNVVFCGDLVFNGGTPFVLMGSVTGALRALREVLGPLGAVTLVPGHGEPCGPGLIGTTIEYLEFVLDIARQGLSAGVPPLEAARGTDLGAYTEWLDKERIVGNLHRAYADLGPGAGKPDLSLALQDMVSYNGGQPLSCHA